MTAEEDFLSRWARRKAEAKVEIGPCPDEAQQPVPDTAESAAEDAAAPAAPGEPDMLRDAPPDEATRSEWIAELEAIDLEALTYEDDFSVFMKNWVPQALRNRALRRLWRTSDVFDVLDGLNDYDEDFSIPAAAVGEIKSAWKPGRGFALDDEDETAADEADAEKPAEASAAEPEAGKANAPANDEEEPVADAGDAPAKSGHDEAEG